LIETMADQVALPNPRTLYSQLRECTSAQARAQAALEFVRGCTNSEGGCLFLMSGGQLSVAANSNGVEPTPELLQEATRTWDRELDRHPEDNKTETLELSTIAALQSTQESPVWHSSKSEAFERRLLSVYRGPNWLPVGLVMLRAREGRALVPIRQVHIEALCNALLDAGDVQERSAGAQTR
jgi:hypothetical protein